MSSTRKYRITGRLGEGAFGAVYLAESAGSGISKRVAIKVLHAERAAVAGLVRRLRDEARMLSMIRHRAIVRVDDLVELDGAWSIIMEYVEGADLAHVLAHAEVPLRAAVEIAEEVCNALHAAYNQNGPDGKPLRLIHRDIKPSNLRLTADGSIKLLDFGIARAEFSTREAATTNTGFGTVIYMAPERLNGEDRHAGDIYALGVTLFELLLGVPPGKHALDKDRTPPGAALATHWKWLQDSNPALFKLICDMMATDPDARPTAKECAKRLSDIQGKLEGDRLEDWAEATVPGLLATAAAPTEGGWTGSIVIERPGPRPATQVAPTVAPEDPFADPPPARSSGLFPILLLAGGAFAGLMLFAGIGAWLYFRPAPTAETPIEKPQPVAVPVVPPEQPKAETPPEPPPDLPKLPSAKPKPIKPTVTPPAPAPAPFVAEEPPPPAAPACGEIALSGDATSFQVSGGTPCANGGWRPGSYAVRVGFGSGAEVQVPAVTIVAGETTILKCSEKFANCKVTR